MVNTRTDEQKEELEEISPEAEQFVEDVEGCFEWDSDADIQTQANAFYISWSAGIPSFWFIAAITLFGWPYFGALAIMAWILYAIVNVSTFGIIS